MVFLSIPPHKIFLNIHPHKDENGDIIGECLELPVVVQGKTKEEVANKMKIAINGYFEAFPDEKKKMIDCLKTEIRIKN